jgi:hypothetical protein|tara:strand:- start:6276 stop:6500 length:225 start_codon:yes stop_codon:yes gene_type:complete
MSIREDYFGTYQSVFLNRIEGHCLQEIKDSKKFLLGTKEELYQKKAKQELAKKILEIIWDGKTEMINKLGERND